MKLSRLAAESAAILARLRKDNPNADAECFVSLKYGGLKGADERDVHGVELFLGVTEPRKWYFEIKTEKEESE